MIGQQGYLYAPAVDIANGADECITDVLGHLTLVVRLVLVAVHLKHLLAMRRVHVLRRRHIYQSVIMRSGRAQLLCAAGGGCVKRAALRRAGHTVHVLARAAGDVPQPI